MPAFLSPLFLVGIAAAAIPIAIHFFYRRTEPIVDFAAMRYLRRAPVEHSRRRRLRELVLLALRVTALVLLALAFARPYFSSPVAARSGAATMVLVDVSASLSAPRVFEAARQRAADAIREAPPTHSVGLAAFAQSADVIAPISQDRAGSVAALMQMKPGAGATRYRAALDGAAGAFEGRSGRLVVVTDLQQSGWDAAGDAGIPATIAVEVQDVGGPLENLAVTALRLEGTEAVATIHNFSERPAVDQVVFAVDGRRVGAVPIALEAGAIVEARMPPGAESGALSASITDRVGYAADNVRYAVLGASDTVTVAVVTAAGLPPESLYLERALAVADGADGFRVTSISSAALSTLDADPLERADVIVVLGTRGITQRGRARLAEFVRRGRGMLLAAGPEVEPAVVKEALEGVIGASWAAQAPAKVTFAPDDSRHPVFRQFGGAGTLANVAFARTARIAAAASTTVIARFSDGSPALVEESSQDGRVLIFGSDLNYRWNDFPLQPGFVPFVHESVRYLASPRNSRREYLVGDFQGASLPGVVQLQGRPVAVNPDPRESDPSRMTAETFHAGISRLKTAAAQRANGEAQEQEDSQAFWWYGLLVMLVSLTVEGIMGRRLG